MTQSVEIGVIGGSGLYNMAGLSDVESVSITTPFGDPSAAITIGTLHGRRVAFLPRHGNGHVLNPTEVPYKANIYAMKKLGVRYLIAVSACGSLQEAYAPGHFMIPDQLYDNTKRRDNTYYQDGFVAHVSVGVPFSPELSKALTAAARTTDTTVHEGGGFITIEGPRFSTRAESKIFRSWGMDIIGMTTSPEAYLAAEAEIAYACLAHITDYDVWHESEEDVTVEMVIQRVMANTNRAQTVIAELAASADDWMGDFHAHSGMKDAFLTAPGKASAETLSKLSLFIGHYFD